MARNKKLTTTTAFDVIYKSVNLFYIISCETGILACVRFWAGKDAHSTRGKFEYFNLAPLSQCF